MKSWDEIIMPSVTPAKRSHHITLSRLSHVQLVPPAARCPMTEPSRSGKAVLEALEFRHLASSPDKDDDVACTSSCSSMKVMIYETEKL